MARRKADNGRTVLLVFGGLALAAGATLAVWIAGDTAKAKKDAAEAAKDLPTLPSGRLQLVHGGMNETQFLALDDLRHRDDGLHATVVSIGRTTTSIEGGGAMAVRRERVDCTSRRIYDGVSGTFDADGKLTAAARGYAARRGRPAEPGDHEIAALCDGAKGRVVADLAAARREAQTLPEGYEKVAEADRKNADAWAWLCSAAARGRWRDAAPQDCAHALELRPDDAALRVDRGYLFLKIGRRAEADADFKRVLAAHPDDATAIYGRSLLYALNGDEAASKRDRGRALDIDEGVPNWVAHDYQIQMSQEYRVR